MLKITSDTGRIAFDKTVYSRIVVESSKKFKGKLALTNSKGKAVKPGTEGTESLNFVEVKINRDSRTVDLVVYMVTKFGFSIRKLTADFAKEIRENTKLITRTEVGEITFIITGVKSRRVVKREIEIKC